MCLERTKTRDQSIHIPVSDNLVEEINRKAFSVDLPFDLVIENEKGIDNEMKIKHFAYIGTEDGQFGNRPYKDFETGNTLLKITEVPGTHGYSLKPYFYYRSFFMLLIFIILSFLLYFADYVQLAIHCARTGLFILGILYF